MVSTLDNMYGVRTFVCKSGDTKPTAEYDGLPIVNGSVAYEMDTKKFYMYDESTNTWVEQ